MAESYERFPGFVGRPGQEFLDEVQRCEAETRRAQGEQREPNYTNLWLDLQEGKITFEEYESLKAQEEVPPEDVKPSVFDVKKNNDN